MKAFEDARLIAALIVGVLTASACSPGEPAAAPTTTTMASTTTTLRATTTTTTLPFNEVAIELVDDPNAARALGELYTWLSDLDAPAPALPPGMVEHLEPHRPLEVDPKAAELHWDGVLDMGRAGVAVVGGSDTVLLVDDLAPGTDVLTGWRVVGADLESLGIDPWFGDPIRRVMIIGTDAREWQDPVRFRGDSLHIVTSNTDLGGGGILGFPRDSWIEAPYGTDKFTHVNAIAWTESDKQVERDLEIIDSDPYLAGTARWRGLDAVIDIIRQGPLGGEVTTQVAEELTGLEIEGYILTGFRDFQLLLNDYGSIMIDVPFAMADAASQAYFQPGMQEMWGRFALAFSRNRHLTGGDFTRSFHQGMVILARLEAALDSGFTQLPYLIGALTRHTWTDLSLEQIMTLGASALLLDPDNVGNEVLPGRVATRGGASVVLINDSAEELYRDLDDGVLGNRSTEEEATED